MESHWNDAFTHVLWRAQNAVHRQVQDRLSELDVTATQLGLAVHLQELGPLSAADLSRGFQLTPQSVGTALGRLERLRWVARRPHPVNRRVVLYALTDQGLAGVGRGREIMDSVNQAIGAAVDDDELSHLLSSLRAVTEYIDGPELELGLAVTESTQIRRR